MTQEVIERPAVKLAGRFFIWRLGHFSFPEGYYVYTGRGKSGCTHSAAHEKGKTLSLAKKEVD